MPRWERLAILVALVTLVPAYLAVDDFDARLNALTLVVALFVAVIEVGRGIRRTPSLTVEYRNHRHNDEAVAWRETPGSQPCSLHVYVKNTSKHAHAEAVEVRFDSLGGRAWNETGNDPDPLHLDQRVSPPAWYGRDRVLAPLDEWCIAMLTFSSQATPRGVAQWTAKARGMKPKEGVIRVRTIEAPPM